MAALEIVASASVLFGSAVAVRIARRFALKKALLDMPNERSSHQIPVPRLGGAAFIPVVMVGVGVGWFGTGLPGMVSPAFFGGCAALFVVSLLDDFRSLSAATRLGVQFAAAGGVVAVAIGSGLEFEALGFELGVSSAGLGGSLVPGLWSLVFGLIVTVWIAGLLNIYNFMDGIDGIAGVQAVVGGVAWFIIARELGASAAAILGAALAAGALGFLTLNWPPAKIFMGDAGSTVIGFCFGVLPLLVWVETRGAVDFGRLLLAAGLVVWPFLADGTFTILRRLKNRENIFKAHRSHLYQRLVIAGKSHRDITLVYGGLPAFGGVLACWVVRGVPYAMLASGLVVAALFFGLWRWTVVSERRGRMTDGGRPRTEGGRRSDS